MRGRPAVVAMLLAPLLAGCLGGGDGGGAQADPTSSSTGPGSASSSSSTSQAPSGPPKVDLLLAFSLAPCRGISLQVPQPLAEVQELLPPRYTAAPTTLVPGGGAGLLAVDLYACDNLTTPTAAVPPTYYGQVYTLIERPVEAVPDAPEAQLHEYVFRLLAAQDILAVLWPRAGYDTYNGSANVSVGPVVPLPVDPGPWAGQGDVGEYFLMASGRQDPLRVLPAETTFARYTQLADGSVLMWTGTYQYGAARSGEGLLRVPANDPFAPFESPAGTLQGFARLYGDASMVGMDLRRIFYPPPAA